MGKHHEKFSVSTEKRQAVKHQLCQLETDIEKTKTQNQLLSIVRNFYGELYQQAKFALMPDDFLSKIDTVLNRNARVSCEGSLSLEELTISVRQLKTGKAQRMDVLPVEFYCAFWDCLKGDLVHMVTEVNILRSCHQVKERLILDYFTTLEIARASQTGSLSVF